MLFRKNGFCSGYINRCYRIPSFCEPRVLSSHYSISRILLQFELSDSEQNLNAKTMCSCWLDVAQECLQDAFYFCDFSEKHVASNCLASVVESGGHVDVHRGRRAGKTPSGIVLSSSLPGHIVLYTTTELSIHFYTVHATFPLCCFSLPQNLSEIYSSVGKAVLFNKGWHLQSR